jgi:hypothetical protein
MSRRQPSTDSPLTASLTTTITTVLDNVRRELQKAGAMARDTAPSIHERYEFESGEPDLGYLSEIVADLMNGIAAKLVVASVLRARSLGVSLAIEEQRRRLRQAQAVLCSMAHFLRTQPQAPHLVAFVSSLTATCESALNALDPTALGLPTPTPKL